MSRKGYLFYSIVTGLLKAAVLAAIVFWLLPLWGLNIPFWGLILLIIIFAIYETVTFKLGRKALEKKPTIASPQAIVGCYGKATTPLKPDGYVQVNGELWHALSDDRNIKEGDEIVVVEMNRLSLRVASLSGASTGTQAAPDIEAD